MQEGPCGDPAALVSPILRACLEAGNQDRMETIMEHLKSSLFIGNTSYKEGIAAPKQQDILRQAFYGEPNCTESTPAGRICLSQSQVSMSVIARQAPTAFCFEIARFAVHDLLWLLECQRFNDSSKYYSCITRDAWIRLPQHERLAIAFALRPNADDLNVKATDKVQDGWEACSDVAALSTCVKERVRCSIQLSIQISQARTTRHGELHVNVVGPFSLAVYSVLAACSRDRPKPKFRVWNEKEASKVMRAAKLTFDYLLDVTQNAGLDEAATSVTKYAFIDGLKKSAPAVICQLGAEAESVLQGLLAPKEVQDLVLEHEWAKNKSLLHLCKAAARFSAGSSFLAHKILEKQYRIDEKDALKCVSAICRDGPSGQDAEEV